MEESNQNNDNEEVDLMHARMADTFGHAADMVLPRRPLKPNRPWISLRTLDLIRATNAARTAAAIIEERRLAKLVKTSVATDRSNWLDDLVSTGDWGAIKHLRKGSAKKQERLRDSSGNLVSTGEVFLRSYSGQFVRHHCCHPGRLCTTKFQ